MKLTMDFWKSDFMYEMRPWFCVALGLYAASMYQVSHVGAAFGGLLMCASLAIMGMRRTYRRQYRN